MRGDIPVPGATVVCFRAVFFFSFFGRIVSELGFVRRLPFGPCAALGPRVTLGIDVTVSVSTVIVGCDDSPDLPLLASLMVLELRDASGGGADPDAAVRRLFFVLPFSLPLS